MKNQNKNIFCLSSFNMFLWCFSVTDKFSFPIHFHFWWWTKNLMTLTSNVCDAHKCRNICNQTFCSPKTRWVKTDKKCEMKLKMFLKQPILIFSFFHHHKKVEIFNFSKSSIEIYYFHHREKFSFTPKWVVIVIYGMITKSSQVDLYLNSFNSTLYFRFVN
jgi:hypothetical protein